MVALSFHCMEPYMSLCLHVSQNLSLVSVNCHALAALVSLLCDSYVLIKMECQRIWENIWVFQLFLNTESSLSNLDYKTVPALHFFKVSSVMWHCLHLRLICIWHEAKLYCMHVSRMPNCQSKFPYNFVLKKKVIFIYLWFKLSFYLKYKGCSFHTSTSY